MAAVIYDLELEMLENSIYHKIKKCILKFGKLPDDFVAEEKTYKENELRFAPGALEGIFGHHMSDEVKECSKNVAAKTAPYLN